MNVPDISVQDDFCKTVVGCLGFYSSLLDAVSEKLARDPEIQRSIAGELAGAADFNQQSIRAALIVLSQTGLKSSTFSSLSVITGIALSNLSMAVSSGAGFEVATCQSYLCKYPERVILVTALSMIAIVAIFRLAWCKYNK